MAFGIIEYNEDGQPKCELCGEYFNRVISHVRQKHDLNEKEYKKQFGFDLKKGICSKESSLKTSIKTLNNYDRCIKNNLEIKGAKTRFCIGDNGRTSDKVSPQTKIRLKERLKEPYMMAAMKCAGEKVGKSGLGNKKRWNKNLKYMENTSPMCGCGYGKATHTFKDLDGLRVHALGEGTCCRAIATGVMIPTNFRMEVWTSYEGTKHENTFLTEVCDVNGQTITKYTLTDQRGYNYDEEFKIWSLPKDKSSVNSLPDNT